MGLPQEDMIAIHSSCLAYMYAHEFVDPLKLSLLIDTGCTHNLLLKGIFDRLPAMIKEGLGPWNTTAMLPVYGKILLTDQIKNLSFSIEFLVNRISNEGILSMSFLNGQKCTHVWTRVFWHGETTPFHRLTSMVGPWPIRSKC